MRTREFDRELVELRARLRRFAVSLCRNTNDADDLVQTTILKALHGHEGYEPGTNMAGWLFTILRNEFLTGRRKAGREIEDPEGIAASHIPAPAAQTHAYDLKIVLGQMDALSPVQRASLELIAMDQMTYEEVAELLGIPEGTVKSQVSRARAQLLDIYEGRVRALRV